MSSRSSTTTSTPTLTMDVDEDDDFYAPEENAQATEQPDTETAVQSDAKPKPDDEGLEEGEEEDGAASEASDDSVGQVQHGR